MDKWDYKMVIVSGDGTYLSREDPENQHHITELGAEGWEITHAWCQTLGDGIQGWGSNYLILRRPYKGERKAGSVL